MSAAAGAISRRSAESAVSALAGAFSAQPFYSTQKGLYDANKLEFS
jgi:hypothetical protein